MNVKAKRPTASRRSYRLSDFDRSSHDSLYRSDGSWSGFVNLILRTSELEAGNRPYHNSRVFRSLR